MLQRSQHFGQLERLPDVGIRIEAHCDLAHVGVAAQQHDAAAGPSSAAVLRDERPAVHDRHLEVEEDQVRLDLSDELEGRRSVAHRRDCVTRLAQCLAQHLGELVIVIDDKNTRVMAVLRNVSVFFHRAPAGARCRTDANGSLA